jgi:hypothetical protein
MSFWRIKRVLSKNEEIPLRKLTDIRKSFPFAVLNFPTVPSFSLHLTFALRPAGT